MKSYEKNTQYMYYIFGIFRFLIMNSSLHVHVHVYNFNDN